MYLEMSIASKENWAKIIAARKHKANTTNQIKR